MIRFAAAASALIASSLIVPQASAAEAGRDQFKAELSAPAARDRIVIRDIVWRCDGATCYAPAGASRPAVVCAALAKAAGSLRSFATGSESLPAEQLEKCNARAR